MERVNSRLDLVGLGELKLRGLRDVAFHVTLCMIAMLLVAVAALRLGRLWKANWCRHSVGEGVDLRM